MWKILLKSVHLESFIKSSEVERSGVYCTGKTNYLKVNINMSRKVVICVDGSDFAEDAYKCKSKPHILLDFYCNIPISRS